MIKFLLIIFSRIAFFFNVSFLGQVWHAVGIDGQPLRKQYLEAILPPFVAILRRWRPLLAGIHELTTSDGLNPLIADDRALAADSLPLEVLELEFFLFTHLEVVNLYIE